MIIQAHQFSSSWFMGLILGSKVYTRFHYHTLCASLKILPIITPAATANIEEIAILPQIMY